MVPRCHPRRDRKNHVAQRNLSWQQLTAVLQLHGLQSLLQRWSIIKLSAEQLALTGVCANSVAGIIMHSLTRCCTLAGLHIFLMHLCSCCLMFNVPLSLNSDTHQTERNKSAWLFFFSLNATCDWKTPRLSCLASPDSIHRYHQNQLTWLISALHLTWAGPCSPPGWADQMFWPRLCQERPHGRTGSSCCRRWPAAWPLLGLGRGLCLSLTLACRARPRSTAARHTGSPGRPSVSQGWRSWLPLSLGLFLKQACSTTMHNEQSGCVAKSHPPLVPTHTSRHSSLRKRLSDNVTAAGNKKNLQRAAESTEITSSPLSKRVLGNPVPLFLWKGRNQTGVFCRLTYSQSERPLQGRPRLFLRGGRCHWSAGCR